MRFPWTAEAEKILRDGFTAGDSFAEISRTIYRVTRLHFSRNACIGKAVRLGCSRPKEVGRANTYRNSPRTARTTTPPAPKRAAPNTFADFNVARRLASPTWPLPLPRADELTPTATIHDLNSHTCRWPIGDPQKPGFGFCGRMKPIDGSYCPEHHKRAYGGLPRPRTEAEKLGDEKRRQSHKARIAARAA